MEHDAAILDHQDLGAHDAAGDDPRIEALLEPPDPIFGKADLLRTRVRVGGTDDGRSGRAREAGAALVVGGGAGREQENEHG